MRVCGVAIQSIRPTIVLLPLICGLCIGAAISLFIAGIHLLAVLGTALAVSAGALFLVDVFSPHRLTDAPTALNRREMELIGRSMGGIARPEEF